MGIKVNNKLLQKTAVSSLIISPTWLDNIQNDQTIRRASRYLKQRDVVEVGRVTQRDVVEVGRANSISLAV